jgi:hypothetical protein
MTLEEDTTDCAADKPCHATTSIWAYRVTGVVEVSSKPPSAVRPARTGKARDAAFPLRRPGPGCLVDALEPGSGRLLLC